MVCEDCQKAVIKFSNLLFLLDSYEPDKNSVRVKEEELEVYKAENVPIKHEQIDKLIENNSDDEKYHKILSKQNQNNDQDYNYEEHFSLSENEENEMYYDEEDEMVEDNDDESDDSFVEEIAIEVVPNNDESSKVDEFEDQNKQERFARKKRKTRRTKRYSYLNVK